MIRCTRTHRPVRPVLRAAAARTRPLSAAPSPAPESVPDEANPENFPKPKFWIPRSARAGRSVFIYDEDMWFGQSRLLRNDRRCPSRDLNFTPLDWANHKSPYRRVRHMINIIKSSTFQRLLFPDLTMTAAIAVGLAYYNETIALSAAEMLVISPTAFGGATTAIGILAGFRLNASYRRYEESRIFWGDTNNAIRDLARQTMMWMRDADQRARMLKLLKAYPVVLNFHLNAKGGHHNLKRHGKSHEPSFDDRVHAEFLAELRDIYADGRDERDLHRMATVKYRGGNAPIEVSCCRDRDDVVGDAA